MQTLWRCVLKFYRQCLVGKQRPVMNVDRLLVENQVSWGLQHIVPSAMLECASMGQIGSRCLTAVGASASWRGKGGMAGEGR